MKKVCPRCYNVKDLEKDFYKKPGYCKTCTSEINRLRYLEVTRFNKPVHSVEYALYVAAKSRAKKKNIPFNLEISDIVIPDICPILGVKITCKTGKLGKNSPSLDVVNTKYGYVKGNVAVISHDANRKKDNSSIKELEKIIAYMKKYGKYDDTDQED